MDLLAQMGIGRMMLALVIIFVCLLLMLVILLQKGRGGGLAGAFGGGGGSSAFGSKTGDVFTWITVVVATVFVLLAIVGNFAFDESATPRTQASAAADPEGAAGTTETGEAPGDVPPATDDGTRTVTFPVPEGVDPSDISADMVTKDGTATPIKVELITEPVAGSEGTEGGTEDKPAEPSSGTDTPEPDQPGGGGDSSTP